MQPIRRKKKKQRAHFKVHKLAAKQGEVRKIKQTKRKCEKSSDVVL